MPLTPVATDMRLIADEAVLEAKVDNPDRWIIHGGAGDGAAEWDHDRVLQLLSNLLAHALDQSSEATPVSFAWWGEDDEVVLEIEYDPEGAGGEREWTLGLSIAREIARAHGGDLEVSDSSSGRLLRVTLPRAIAVRAGGRREAGRPSRTRRRSTRARRRQSSSEIATSVACGRSSSGTRAVWTAPRWSGSRRS